MKDENSQDFKYEQQKATPLYPCASDYIFVILFNILAEGKNGLSRKDQETKV